MIESETTHAVGYHIRSAINALAWYPRIGEMTIDEAIKSLAKAQNWLEEAKKAEKAEGENHGNKPTESHNKAD